MMARVMRMYPYLALFGRDSLTTDCGFVRLTTSTDGCVRSGPDFAVVHEPAAQSRDGIFDGGEHCVPAFQRLDSIFGYAFRRLLDKGRYEGANYAF